MRSSKRVRFQNASSVKLPVVSASPPTLMLHGVGLKLPELAAGSALSVPNS